MPEQTYPIGVPGQPWGAAEKAAWRARQPKLRSQKARHRLVGLAVHGPGAHADLQDRPPLDVRLPAVDTVDRGAGLQFQGKVGDGSGSDKQGKSTPNLDNKSQPGNGSASDASSH